MVKIPIRNTTVPSRKDTGYPEQWKHQFPFSQSCRNDAKRVAHATIAAFEATVQQGSDQYKNKWLNDSIWTELIKRHNPALKVDTTQYNRAFGNRQAYKLSLHSLGGAGNDTGVFQETKYDEASKKNAKY